MLSDTAFADSLSENDTYRSKERWTAKHVTSTSNSAALADVVAVVVTVGDRHFQFNNLERSALPVVKDMAHELARFAALLPNWNSYRSRPISESSLENAADIAFNTFLRSGIRPLISPMSDGGVSLVWQHNGREHEVEIVNDTVSVLSEQPNGDREYENLTVAGTKMLLRDWL